jgi:elongation factor Ts
MSEISAAAVMKLRNRTGAPMMDCKAALAEAGGDAEKAVEVLRKKSAGIQAKKADRETAEGRIGIFIDPAKKVGSIVEMRCESAPVVKSDQFIALTNQVAKQIAFKNPSNIPELLEQAFVDDPKKKVTEVIAEVIGLIRESMKPARMTRMEGLLGNYIHHDGSVGVLIQVEGTKADPQLLRDICMHITAKNPAAATREEVTPEFIEKEKEIAREQATALGKPAKVVDMIIESKMKTWFKDNVLLEQPFVKDDTKTVSELLNAAGLKFVRYVRYKVGELT